MRVNLFTTLVLLVGCFWVYDGLHRGSQYYPLLAQAPEQLVVSNVANLNGRTLLPDYVAVGSVSNIESPIVIGIFENQYRKLRAGSLVAVYHFESSKHIEWVNGERFEESRPLMSVLGLHFSWHFPAGLLMTAYACFSAWNSRRRLKELANLLGKHSSPADSGAAPPSHPAK
jgi:hypothetical protein